MAGRSPGREDLLLHSDDLSQRDFSGPTIWLIKGTLALMLGLFDDFPLVHGGAQFMFQKPVSFSYSVLIPSFRPIVYFNPPSSLRQLSVFRYFHLLESLLALAS